MHPVLKYLMTVIVADVVLICLALTRWPATAYPLAICLVILPFACVPLLRRRS